MANRQQLKRAAKEDRQQLRAQAARAAALAGRRPIRLPADGALQTIVQQALEASDPLKVALAAFAQGRGLHGPWAVNVLGLELRPVQLPREAKRGPAS